MAEMKANAIQTGTWETAKTYVKGFVQGLKEYYDERNEESIKNMEALRKTSLKDFIFHPEKLSDAEKGIIENTIMMSIPVGRVGAIAKSGGNIAGAAMREQGTWLKYFKERNMALFDLEEVSTVTSHYRVGPSLGSLLKKAEENHLAVKTVTRTGSGTTVTVRQY